MPPPISPIQNIALSEAIQLPGQAAKPGEFQSVLEGAIGKVEQFRTDAGQAVEQFLSGEGEELHTTVLATQRAELAFELGLQVRNKIVQAYQEVMRLQM